MSSVAFTDSHDEARVSGADRHHFATTLWGMTRGMLDLPTTRPYGEADAKWRRALGIRDESEIGQLETRLHIESRPFMVAGVLVNPFELHLNTGIVFGGDAIRFAARVHGQCEIHGFVEGPNRAWLADIIERGPATIFREPRRYDGWPGVVRLLRARSDEPVAMSYSVTEGFPSNIHCRDISDAKWDRMSHKRRWAAAVESLRAMERAGRWLEMKPESWAGFRFGDGLVTALSLRERILAACRDEPRPTELRT
jgi:hypothetical protein